MGKALIDVASLTQNVGESSARGYNDPEWAKAKPYYTPILESKIYKFWKDRKKRKAEKEKKKRKSVFD